MTSSQTFERNSQSIRVGCWSIIITHKFVKICPLSCSSWSSKCGICLFLVFSYTFPGFFDGDWFYMTDHVRLILYKFVLCHFNNFVINEAFFQRIAYVLNTRQHLNFLRLPIDISNRLFNSLYLPILMYGSEVWSIYDRDDYNSRESDIIEKTQMQFGKQVLGVNKQCPNVRGHPTTIFGKYLFGIRFDI